MNEQVFVPETLRTKIIQIHYNTLIAGNNGKYEIYVRIAWHYYWPRCMNSVAYYVCNCLTCSRAKSYRDSKHGLLHPLPIPNIYWTSVLINFITPLPDSTWNN